MVIALEDDWIVQIDKTHLIKLLWMVDFPHVCQSNPLGKHEGTHERAQSSSAGSDHTFSISRRGWSCLHSPRRLNTHYSAPCIFERISPSLCLMKDKGNIDILLQSSECNYILGIRINRRRCGWTPMIETYCSKSHELHLFKFDGNNINFNPLLVAFYVINYRNGVTCV